MASSTNYENSDLFLRRQSNPFDEEFEQSLKTAPVLPTRRQNSIEAASPQPPTIYSRQTSSVSSRTSSRASSYDDFTPNFGRPVTPPKLRPSGSIEEEPENSDTHVRTEVTYNTPPAPRPVPAPRLSKTKQIVMKTLDEPPPLPLTPPPSLPEVSDEKVVVCEVIYEELGPRLAAEGDTNNLESSEDASKNDSGATDNLYSEIGPAAASAAASQAASASGGTFRASVANLMDKSDDEEEESEKDEEEDDILEELNKGKALLNPKLTTIDIRKGFEKLYEKSAQEAEQERELVDYLEKKEADSSPAQQPRSRASLASANAYDSVALPDVQVRIINGMQVPMPPTTLLKNFDPCYEKWRSEDHGGGEGGKISTTNSSLGSSPAEDRRKVAPPPMPMPRSSRARMQHPESSTSESELESGHPSRRGSGANGLTTEDDSSRRSSFDLPPPSQSPPKPPPRFMSPASRPQSDEEVVPPRNCYENVWVPPEERKDQIVVAPKRRSISPVKSVSRSSSLSNKSQHSQGGAAALPSSSKVDPYTECVPSDFAVDDLKKDPVLKATPPPLPRRHSNIYGTEFHLTDGAGALPDAGDGASYSKPFSSSANSSPMNSRLVQRSASTTNLTSIAKKFSFSKLLKISEQVMKPGREAATLEDISESSALPSSSSSVRRKSSFASMEYGFPGTKHHSGPLFVFSKSKKGVVQEKWCILSNANLRYYNREDSLAEPKELILLKDVLSIYKREESEWLGKDDDTPDLHVFDIAFVSGGKGKLSVRSFGAIATSTRDAWVDKVAASLSPQLTSFPFSVADPDCTKVGWAFLKVMFAGEWAHSWIALRGRHFFYTMKEDEEAERVDLKKTKNVTLVKDVKNLNAPESMPVLVVDFVDRSLYIQCLHEKESAHWKNALEAIAFENGAVLADQQLTKDDLPVVVEQCVNFVFRHGCLTEGIYRHSGVKTKIDRQLADFRKNAWAVQISRDEYSEHDVANTLKRFMRTLDEPLLTEKLRPKWMAATKIPNKAQRVQRYSSLLSRLPAINQRTLRRLIGHLRTVANQSERNRMSPCNLAAIWGPTLLTVDGQAALNFAQTSGESDVCKDLIEFYMELFDVSKEEMDREEEIMKKQENFNRNPNPVKLSGEMMMFVHIDTKTGGNCVSIAVTPKMTARELTHRVLKKAKFSGDTSHFLLHEVVLAGELERPLHYNEQIYEVTLKWWQWSDEDRRDVYLLLKRNTLFEEAVPCAIPPLSVFGETLFGNVKAKSGFKRYQFSMNNAKITRSKEGKNGVSTEVDSWDIEKIIWYFGCESRRQAPHQLNVTFIERGVPVERTKEKPYFGRTLSFGSRELFIKWVAAMLVAEHQGDILPKETLLNIEED